MGQLVNLAGTDGKPRDVEFFHSVSKAMMLLRRDRCATTAGSLGAINIWIDDDGKYRGERMAWMTTVSEAIVKTKTALKEWLIQELPLTGDHAALADEAGGKP